MHYSSCLACVLVPLLLLGCAHRDREFTVDYACDSGRDITVTYRPTEGAILQMGPRQIPMRAAASPLGERYVSPQLQWVTRDRDGAPTATLFTRGFDGGPGDIAERCHETDRD